ncbi:LPXTG cell wall anchor domain-containing protein [Parvibium lacunae]|uniref:LPXTG cell wall anchor domain-containing protein n=1 Tax=Parvibium lacunae TaxID=1888893 RepID=A0A368L5M4_9BURK|nr:LPXTG cell wall anchor domain-containing protein [Parvibium lacunae]
MLTQCSPPAQCLLGYFLTESISFPNTNTKKNDFLYLAGLAIVISHGSFVSY